MHFINVGFPSVSISNIIHSKVFFFIQIRWSVCQCVALVSAERDCLVQLPWKRSSRQPLIQKQTEKITNKWIIRDTISITQNALRANLTSNTQHATNLVSVICSVLFFSVSYLIWSFLCCFFVLRVSFLDVSRFLCLQNETITQHNSEIVCNLQFIIIYGSY